jgi:hypothetical protein
VSWVATSQEIRIQLDRLCAELDERDRRHRVLVPYVRRVDGSIPTPQAVISAGMSNAYRVLMGMAQTPWGKLVLNSKLDRLEVTGIDTGDKRVDKVVWDDVWQLNAMDLEAKLAHRSSLLDGRSHALVWPGADGLPEITLDDATQMVVAYREGNRRRRVAALRRWLDDEGLELATLYRPDGIFKFRRRRNGENPARENPFGEWVIREVPDEPWPAPNPFKVVPVVELAVNRELQAGSFAFARGEFEDEIGLIDRINLLTFLGLVVGIWMGFPLRYTIGERIIRDDDNNPLPPFKAAPDSIAQLEDPAAKLGQLEPADRANLSIFDELAQLAAATSTPRHYFPTSGAIANVSAETIRAFEGPMHAVVNGEHKPSLGESHEEILRLGAMMLPTPVVVPPQASLVWADHESRSLAERADAYLKLTSGESPMPWAAAAQLALNVSAQQLRQWEADNAGSSLARLVTAAQSETPGPVTAPAGQTILPPQPTDMPGGTPDGRAITTR